MLRRKAIVILGAAAFAATSALLVRLGGEEKPKRKVLLFTKSSGYEHDVVKRKGDEPSLVERVLVDLGKKHGFEVTATKDGRVFDGELSGYDAFFFYTSGDLFEAGTDKTPPMSAKGKEALLAAVQGGKGFLAAHAASDSFHTPGSRFENQAKPDPYLAMLGGEFIRHGPQQEAKARVTDTAFPGQKAAGESFRIQEEWYSLKNFAPDVHVIHVLETEGMEGLDYKRPPFPLTWARKHGKGRVFYTALGHRDDVWTSPMFQEMLRGAIAWAAGDAEADVPPNMAKVTPHADVLPPEK
ncbi:MAG: ThuA domain-containing protein [Planctomycetes bacterium]|nr:ThuA domain-containing protein [Planctomycetota bacterium]